jgi:hypothetical protein
MRTNKPENIINASLLKSIEKLFIPFEASSTLRSRSKARVVKKKQPRKSPNEKTIRTAR